MLMNSPNVSLAAAEATDVVNLLEIASNLLHERVGAEDAELERIATLVRAAQRLGSEVVDILQPRSPAAAA